MFFGEDMRGHKDDTEITKLKFLIGLDIRKNATNLLPENFARYDFPYADANLIGNNRKHCKFHFVPWAYLLNYRFVTIFYLRVRERLSAHLLSES